MALNINGTTGISGVDGSVSAPAVTGTDSNTGITFPSADTIKFATGGVERLAISNSGLSGDGSGLTGIQAGITMADQWRTYNTQAISGNTATTVTSWERNDNTFAGIGSAMNESSGVFTFPTTGIYLVTYNFTFWDTSGDNRYITSRLKYNNSYICQPFTSLKYISGETFANLGSNAILDVTSTSHELFFSVVSENTFQIAGNNWAGVGNENVNLCDVTFIRLGDT